MDRDLVLAQHIHGIVAVLNEYSERFELMLKTDSEVFPFDRTAIEAMKTIVDTNAYLVSKLFEESQTLYDGIEKTIQKAKDEKQKES